MKPSAQNIIIRDRVSALLRLGILSEVEEKINMEVLPDYDISKYEGPVEKEYSLQEWHDLSKKYSIIFEAGIGDYGYRVEDDDTLYRALNDSGSGELSYKIAYLDRQARKIEFRGSLFGSGFEIGAIYTPVLCKLNLLALVVGCSMPFYRELIAEAYSLELDGQTKFSFFLYFAAIDHLINKVFNDVNDLEMGAEIPEELRQWRLRDKLKFAMKHKLNGADVGGNALCNEALKLFTECVSIRNEIAHGQLRHNLRQDDLNCVFALCIIIAIFLDEGCTDLSSLEKFIFPS